MAMHTLHPRQEHRKAMAMAVTVPQLLTPEEHFEDNFAPKAPVVAYQATVPSPPASPESRPFTTEARFRANDDLLYPENTCANDQHAHRPLFDSREGFTTPERPSSPSTESELSIATPSTQHGSPLQKGDTFASPSRRESQDAAPTTPVGPVQLLNHYGLDYFRFCRMQCDDYLKQKMEDRTLPPLTTSRRAGRDGYTQKVISSLGRSYRVEKPTAVNQNATKPKVSKITVHKAPARSVTPSATLTKHESSGKRSRRQASTSDVPSGASFLNTVQPKPRTRAAPTKKIDDAIDWRQIPDFCPPLSTLEEVGRQLSVHWTNNNELNLSDDPDRAELHPHEIKLAATLRLKCNSYLANKRRIFKGKVEALREGKDFNKTSAQNVTNIDVNKASRLWTAFDQAGWFDEELFKAHL